MISLRSPLINHAFLSALRDSLQEKEISYPYLLIISLLYQSFGQIMTFPDIILIFKQNKTITISVYILNCATIQLQLPLDSSGVQHWCLNSGLGY